MTDKEWLEDAYVKEWLNNVGERTRKNYIERFPKWLAFIKMSPTEQIEKRIADLGSKDLRERTWFEGKVKEFKNMLVAQKYKPWTVHGCLTVVLSFFANNRLRLSFARSDLRVETQEQDKVLTEWILINEEARVIYSLADIRDRALFLVLYQSGFSEADVSALNIENLRDVYTQKDIYEIEGNLFIQKKREKTDILQRTVISAEAIHDIKAMLKARGSPKSGALFVSPKGKRLDVRFINEAMKSLVEKAFPEKASLFKTKSLRDAFNDALLRAEITEEVKDSMFGHKREGAKGHYAISPTTILEAYDKAFKFLSVNGGQQAKKDIERLDSTIDVLSEKIAKQQETITVMHDEIAQLTGRLAERDRELAKIGYRFDEQTHEITEIKRALMQIQDILKIRKKDEGEQ